LKFSTVVSKATGKALDSGGGNNSVYPHPSPNPGNNYHSWGFEKVGDEYIIINKATGKALDGGGDGGKLPYAHPDPQKNNSYQLWKLQKVGDAYLIINKATGRALDSGGANGNHIYMHPTPISGNSFHQWKLNLPNSGGGSTQTGYVNSPIGLNFRTGPSLGDSQISVLPNGTQLTILEKVSGGTYNGRNDWYKVKVGNTVGYVAAAYVSAGSNNDSGGGGNSPIDKFINWAMSQNQTITRHDRLSLGTWSDGECVTLIARYIQDVFMSPSERSKPGQAYNHGYGTASNVSNLPYFGSYTTRAGLSSNPPRRGGVISFMGLGFDATYGHVGIVTRYDAATNRIYYIDIGKSQGGVVTGEKSISATSAAIRGWTNPK
jgi:hypothetical protein